MEERTAPIPQAIINALIKFRAAHGRNWKSVLCELWMQGQDEGDLRWARNVIGPSGLKDVKLPEVEKVAKPAIKPCSTCGRKTYVKFVAGPIKTSDGFMVNHFNCSACRRMFAAEV